MAKKGRRKSTTRKGNVAQNKMKRVAAKRANQRRKSNASNASDQVSLNELKNYMSSLLDEIKDTRGNLLTWLKEELKKAIADEVASELQRRQCSFQLQQQTGNLEGTQAQNTSKSKQLEHQNDSKQHPQMHNQGNPMEQLHQTMITDVVSTQQQQHQLPNFEEKDGTGNLRSIRESIKQQQESPLWSLRRDHNCDVEIPQRFANNNSKRPSDANNFSNPGTANPNGDSMAIEPIIPSSPPPGLEIQDPKIVLGIGAQQRTSGMSKRYRNGKMVTDSGNYCNAPEGKEVDCSQAIISVTSSPENSDQARRFGQETPSMYLTLPTVVKKPHGANRNHRLDAPSLRTVQPYGVPGTETSFNAERLNLLSGSGSYLGYLQRLRQNDERSSRSFAAMGSRDMSYLRNNCMTSPIAGSRFPVGLYQSVNGNFNAARQLGMEGLSRESNHGVGWRIPGGGSIRYSGGNYSLPLHHFPNNFH
ncbi:hypothetical protein LINPERPRIM_LOCUS8455 [Linum perenne]